MANWVDSPNFLHHFTESGSVDVSVSLTVRALFKWPEHLALIVTVLSSRYENVQDALLVIALVVVVEHVSQPHGARIVLMDASVTVFRFVVNSFASV